MASAALAVAVTVVLLPEVFGNKVAIGPPAGPLPLAYQPARSGEP